MLKSKSTNSASGDSPEEIIVLNDVCPNSNLQIEKININDADFALNYKQENSSTYDPNLYVKEKESESDDSEKSKTTKLIHPTASLRWTKISPEAMEEQATTIANRMERKTKLMGDNPVSELLRLETIRNMPQSLTLKRSIKAKITVSVSQKSKNKPIGYWKKLKYQSSMTVSKLKIAFHQVGSSVKLWYNPIKTIEGHFGSGIATYFKFLRWLFVMNTFGCIFSILFITLPQSLVQFHQNETFRSWDLLLGNGIFTNSIFYYGFYMNGTLVVGSTVAYEMPSAYFATFLFCYVFTFILLCSKVAKSYKKSYIETSGGAYNRYANKIFCSWDWGISSFKAASLRSSSIYRELEELLWESKNAPTSSSYSMKIWTLLIRVAMSTLIFAIMCATGALLWLLLNEHQADEKNILSVLTVPVIMTAILNVLSPLVSWSVKFERYTKYRVAIYITMIRVYIIAVISVATLLIFWMTRGIQVGCWQTRLAQEIYRLIVLDLFLSIFGVFLVQAIRSSSIIRAKFGAPTFDIARNTLNLIYNQSLFWMVHYFSPPMSVIILIKLLITFYVKKCELLRFCEPPSKFWRAAQMQTVFLALTFLGMLSAIAVLSYVFIYVNAQSCGPFSGHEFAWELIVEGVLHLRRDSTIWKILGEIVNPGTGIVLLIAMGIAVYYLRAKAEASKQMVRILREMLVWQARDKEFLLKSYSSVSDKKCLRHRPSSKIFEAPNSNNEPNDRVQTNEPSTSY